MVKFPLYKSSLPSVFWGFSAQFSKAQNVGRCQNSRRFWHFVPLLSSFEYLIVTPLSIVSYLFKSTVC